MDESSRTIRTLARVPYALVLIEDAGGGELPEEIRGTLVTATGSCVAIGCVPDADGETEFLLGPWSELDPGDAPVFDGVLDTPSRRIAIHTVEGTILVEVPVEDTSTRVRIWAGHPREPERIIVGL